MTKDYHILIFFEGAEVDRTHGAVSPDGTPSVGILSHIDLDIVSNNFTELYSRSVFRSMCESRRGGNESRVLSDKSFEDVLP